jgi:Flp pilus assembly protein TadG
MRTQRAVYSENKPIPVDIAMPTGVYYKVQVGAFRNDIPQNLYDEFAPVCGEKLNNGITRYTAGFFVTLQSANQVKQAIRGIGYKDAFVVAYRDGKRIPIYEALAITNGTEMIADAARTSNNVNATVADKTSAKSVASNASSSTANNASTAALASSESTKATTLAPKLNDVPDYYKAEGNAVPADQVEKIQGLFYTVQVGVYSKPVDASLLGYITPLNTELLKDSKLRYTSGRYITIDDAKYKREQARSLGIQDAFITAYYNGVRITVSEAQRLLTEQGPTILAK